MCFWWECALYAAARATVAAAAMNVASSSNFIAASSWGRLFLVHTNVAYTRFSERGSYIRYPLQQLDICYAIDWNPTVTEVWGLMCGSKRGASNVRKPGYASFFLRKKGSVIVKIIVVSHPANNGAWITHKNYFIFPLTQVGFACEYKSACRRPRLPAPSNQQTIVYIQKIGDSNSSLDDDTHYWQKIGFICNNCMLHVMHHRRSASKPTNYTRISLFIFDCFWL